MDPGLLSYAESQACEIGAMPPFGHLYHSEVWVDRVLTENASIVFQAGNHMEPHGQSPWFPRDAPRGGHPVPEDQFTHG